MTLESAKIVDVERLDRERRGWRLACVLSFLASLGLVSILGAQVPPPPQDGLPEDVAVSELTLVDLLGRRRAVLGTGLDNSPHFTMLDAQGQERLRLRLLKNEFPSIALLSDKGVEMISLSIKEKDQTELSFKDAKGVTRSRLTLGGGKAESCFALCDAEGSDRCVLRTDASESSSISFLDKGRRTRLQLGVDRAGAGLDLIDGQNRTIARLGVTPGGEPRLTLMRGGEEKSLSLP